ncbi:MAG TPA: MTH865 family protein [Candidatus Bipolaricaulota bacterium]
MSAREELSQNLKTVFSKARFPIKSVMDLLPILPQGPMTKFQGGGKSFTAMDLSTKLGGGNFPYNNVDDFVNDILSGLESKGLL